MARARKTGKAAGADVLAEAGAPGARAPAPRRRRSRAVVREAVSAPAGFGGADGTMTFAHVIAEAMLAVEGLSALPPWWPISRLPGLRGSGMQAGIERACRRHLGVGPGDAVACCSSAGDRAQVTAAMRFATCSGETPVDWDGPEGVEASVARCAGTIVLLLRGPGDMLHLAAPAVVQAAGAIAGLASCPA